MPSRQTSFQQAERRICHLSLARNQAAVCCPGPIWGLVHIQEELPARKWPAPVDCGWLPGIQALPRAQHPRSAPSKSETVAQWNDVQIQDQRSEDCQIRAFFRQHPWDHRQLGMPGASVSHQGPGGPLDASPSLTPGLSNKRPQTSFCRPTSARESGYARGGQTG